MPLSAATYEGITVTSVKSAPVTKQVKYIDADGAEQTVEATVISGFEAFDYYDHSMTLFLGEEGKTSWYAVLDDVELDSPISTPIRIRGDVNLIIAYGANAAWYFGKSDTEPEEVSADIPVYGSTIFSGNLPEGVRFAGATLSLKSQTTLSLYFSGNQGFTLTCSDPALKYEVMESDNESVIRIRNIAAYDLDKDITVLINGSEAVTYSPLTYCYQAANSENINKKLKNTVKALYKYWLESYNYFNRNQGV